MTTAAAVLIDFKFAEPAQTPQYTSSNCKTLIDKFTATNNTAANVAITIHLVKSGGTAGPVNALTKVIAPGTTWPFPELVGQMLEAGDFVSTLAGAATSIQIRASGRKIT